MGSILLLSPIAVATGMILDKKEFSIKTLRDNIHKIVESTTPIDAVNFYDALSIANPGGLGRVPRLDVTNPSSKNEIIHNQITLQEIFQIAAGYDSIAFEWVNNYEISFSKGYPYFASQLTESNDINVATVHTFLKILSDVPDTLITRKVGLTKSQEVSRYAQSVLELGGLNDSQGREKLQEFDVYLRRRAHVLNPGTTADIVTAVISVTLLEGYRP